MRYGVVGFAFAMLTSVGTAQVPDSTRMPRPVPAPALQLGGPRRAAVVAGPRGYTPRTLHLTGSRVDTLLEVTDDNGILISPDLIRSHMHSRERANWVTAGVLVGAAIGAMLTPDNQHSCDIYDPCTDREKYLGNNTWKVGALVGLITGSLLPGPGTRWDAIEEIRADRRRGGP